MQIDQLDDVIAVAGGGAHAIAVEADGSVWEWGRRPAAPSTDLPVLVEEVAGAVGVDASDAASAAVLEDGSLWTWGHGSATCRVAWFYRVVSPGPVPGIDDVRAVDSGVEHAIVLRGDGTAWTCGVGYALGTDDDLRLEPAQVPGLSGVTAVAAGWYTSFAVAAG